MEYKRKYDMIAEDDLAADQPLVPFEYNKFLSKKTVDFAGLQENEDVADWGSGRGLLLASIKNARSRTAVDITDHYFIAFPPDVRTVQANLEQYVAPQAFTTIFCTDVLEHTDFPDKVVANAFDSLKPGGKLVVRVPYDETVPKINPKYGITHQHSFDKVNIRELLAVHGFHVQKIKLIGSRPTRKLTSIAGSNCFGTTVLDVMFSNLEMLVLAVKP